MRLASKGWTRPLHVVNDKHFTMSRLLAACITVGLVAGICTAQTVTTRLPIFVDRAPTPPIAGLVAESTAVIRGRVETTRFETIGGRGDVTKYIVHITATAHAHSGHGVEAFVKTLRLGAK
jgi:hypothetical protein